MANVFVKYPKIGDHVVARLSDKKKFFIAAETFDLSSLDTDTYMDCGAVAARRGREVLWFLNERASKAWSNKFVYKITGYTLDGETHTGVIGYRESSSATANTEITVEYSATAVSELAEQLNAVFAANETLASQGWTAFVKDDELYVYYTFTFGNQVNYNSFSTGWSKTNALLPDIEANSYMRRKNGYTSGVGTISSMARAITYFTADNSNSSYNPASDVTSIKKQYPVCLPAYLGESSYQDDHCALLREYYGEGEEGWLNFMESLMSVVPTDYGSMKTELDGYAYTKTLAEYEINGEYPCAAAIYAHEYESDAVDAGEMYLPTPRDLHDLLLDDTLAAVSAAFVAAGKSALASSANLWSCARCYASGAWCSYGSNGYFSSCSMYFSCYVVPTSLLTIED